MNASWLFHRCFHHPVDYEWGQDTALSHSCVDSEGYRKISIVDESTAGILIEALDDVYHLLRNAVVSHDSPTHSSVHHFKRLLEVNNTDMQR